MTKAARWFVFNVIEMSRILDGVKATYQGKGAEPTKFALPDEVKGDYFKGDYKPAATV